MPSSRQASAWMRRAVGGAVVGHHALDLDAVGGVEGDRAAQERDRGRGLLVGEDLDVGQAGGVVDADVHELPAARCRARRRVARRGVWLALCRVTRCPAPRDPAELLDVDVDQLAGMRGARSGWAARAAPAAQSLPSPIRSRTAETVESAIARHSAISAPVIRSRRSASIDLDQLARRCGAGSTCGAEERSNKPGLALGAIATDPLASTCARSRRRPRPPPSATSPCSTTRQHHRQPALRAERALA